MTLYYPIRGRLGWGTDIHMGPALLAFLSYGHDLKVLSTFCFSLSALQKLRHPEIRLFSFASFLVSRLVSFIFWPVKLCCSSHTNKSMLLECILVSSLLKGPSLSFSPRLILLQYPLVCWIAHIYEDIQFIHFILKFQKPSLSVHYRSRCLNIHYADLLLSVVSRGSKNDLIPINNWGLEWCFVFIIYTLMVTTN